MHPPLQVRTNHHAPAPSNEQRQRARARPPAPHGDLAGRPSSAPIAHCADSAEHAAIERCAAAKNAGITGYRAPGFVQFDEPSASSGPIVDVWTFGPEHAYVASKMKAMRDADEAEMEDFVDALSEREIKEALDVGLFRKMTKALPTLKLGKLKHPHAW